MNYEMLRALSDGLTVTAAEVDRLAEKNFDLAEDILDFERGTITLPELVNKAKETLK